MPSSPTTSLRLELQTTGENTNTWGSKLNASTIQLIEDAIAGVASLTVSGATTLTSVNYATDQARKPVLILTGTGGTLTIPSVVNNYIVINNCSGTVTFDAGGTTFALLAGLGRIVICDGSNVLELSITDMGGLKVTNVGTPSASTDATTKGAVATLLTALETTLEEYADDADTARQVQLDAAIASLVAGVLTATQAASLATLDSIMGAGIGDDDQELTVVAGAPEWTDIPAPPAAYEPDILANRWRFR